MNKSEKRTELQKLVVLKLETGGEFTAKELYSEVYYSNPILVSRGYKSFVKLINIFPNIKTEGKPQRYRLVTLK